MRRCLVALLLLQDVLGGPCADEHSFCAVWARKGACKENSAYMWRHCPKSCDECDRFTTTTVTSTEAPTTTPPPETSTSQLLPENSTTGLVETTSVVPELSQTKTKESDPTELPESTNELSETTNELPETTTMSPVPPTSKTTAPPTTQAVTTTTAKPLVPNAKRCSAYDHKANTDVAGTMLAVIPAPSDDVCCSKCDTTPRCAGFSFYLNVCYLKTNLQGTFRKSGCTSQIRKPSVTKTECSTFSQPEANKDLAGQLLAAIYAPEPAECCAACGREPKCQGFAYFDSYCYLKTNVAGTFYKPGCSVQMQSPVRRLEAEPLTLV
ncbi:unnamed protein product [Effrenium voratum]|uniref:ShKT domain-containing protein n=1 Tax=Effrenium voratum TaxID=2562239 RepID=A0AA36NDC9_9DINO|nr:unnamed protein product [Effrenium voratum]CAJ1408335.1 unnamed protein product [Effrenium voratum]